MKGRRKHGDRGIGCEGKARSGLRWKELSIARIAATFPNLMVCLFVHSDHCLTLGCSFSAVSLLLATWLRQCLQRNTVCPSRCTDGLQEAPLTTLYDSHMLPFESLHNSSTLRDHPEYCACSWKLDPHHCHRNGKLKH